MKIENLIEGAPQLIIKKNEPLSLYTYTKTGGPADILVFPKTIEEVQQVLLWSNENDEPLTVLGNASNLIVKDGGIRGVTMILTEMNAIQVEGNNITAQSGAKLIDTTYVALDHSLEGMAFACGIPGSIGGAVYMNAGAYGGEISEVLASAILLTKAGEIIEVSNEELAFSYRMSSIQSSGAIVLSATFALKHGMKPLIEERMKELTELREAKQPLEYPSCGSVFKRPPGYFTGKLIQDAHLQGHMIGGAQVSMKHAGFIVNINQATATDYIDLIQHIQAVILAEFDVVLETEVKIIGED
ncbi:UDP-N-acetylmuramate dehydrogenase [Isobaculum melis]|uniref:UDP-N-acetylenolpyruvoylglucosamine reductase n=1 Tax=Isobaculum melis TaxID=142588 RepID=A0A1H9TG22_9LACT|nr:UDP-N-acetylmuramate dehydrogenase [Isobaculum melis]SER96068.1 UDP-N-acetylmuramate dehydrogenase [Isobaculum melis]